ncbi:MAG: ubiquitin-like protein UBact [Nitrospira sp.]|nr:ubiquitin-like protein UBact [Nitrospira sp.]
MIQSLMPERRERPGDPMPKSPAPGRRRGPRRPETGSPDKDSLLKRMRRVDPKQAERYRQRTGE